MDHLQVALGPAPAHLHPAPEVQTIPLALQVGALMAVRELMVARGAQVVERGAEVEVMAVPQEEKEVLVVTVGAGTTGLAVVREPKTIRDQIPGFLLFLAPIMTAATQAMEMATLALEEAQQQVANKARAITHQVKPITRVPLLESLAL